MGGAAPIQMVSSGMSRNVKVVTAPTMYDHTPLQYMTRSNGRSRNWNSGQRRRFRMIWKCCTPRRMRGA